MVHSEPEIHNLTLLFVNILVEDSIWESSYGSNLKK